MTYTVDMASDGVMYVPSFIGLDIQVMLQCWYD
jgi:hypothetical protein